MTQPIPVIEQLRERLTLALQPQHLHIDDESAAHLGHAGAREGGHYAVRVVSARFAGLAPLARHRLVYSAAGDLLHNGVHALRIDAQPPD